MAELNEITPVSKTVDVRHDDAAKALAAGTYPKIGKLVKAGDVVRVFLEVDGVMSEPLEAVAVPVDGLNVYAEVRLRMPPTELTEAAVGVLKAKAEAAELEAK